MQTNINDTVIAPTGIPSPNQPIQSSATYTVVGPGRSFGNAGLWTVDKQEYRKFCVGQRGIAQAKSLEMYKYAVGDTAGEYYYVFADGGVTAQSDEGVTGITVQVNESPGYFKASVVKTTGAGDTTPVYGNLTGADHVTDGAFMLNLSKPVIHGNMLGRSEALTLSTGPTFLNYLPVTGGLPISTAIGVSLGTTQIAPNNNYTADAPQPVTIHVELAQIGGVAKPFLEGQYVSVAGNWYPEQAKLTAVLDNHDGTMLLSMNLRNPNQQCIVFQGPLAGKFISFGANLRTSGMRSTYYAFGSLTGDDLIYGVNVGGGLESFTLPNTFNEAAVADGGPNSDFELISGAEVVRKGDMAYSCSLEQNPIQWAVGDLVENPHYPVFAGTGIGISRNQTTPSHPRSGMFGLLINMLGTGFAGANVAAQRIVNYNPSTMYRGQGGLLGAPGGIELQGDFACGLNMTTVPQDPGTGKSAVIYVQNPTSNPTAPINVIEFNFASGGHLYFLPSGTPDPGTWRMNKIDVDILSIHGSVGYTGTIVRTEGTEVYQSGVLMSWTPTASNP